MNISKMFFLAAEKHPHKIAIIEKDSRITYQLLATSVVETAAYFEQKGIKPGDRVLVFVPMSIDLYRIVLALFYLGATAVFLDEWVDMKRLNICCQLADCKGFIAGRKIRFFSIFSQEIRKISIKLNINRKISQSIEMAQTSPSDSALITFTTGSTGTPKAADRTHAFLNEQFNALVAEIEPDSNDIDLPVLPIVLFVNLGVGCTSVIADFKMTKPKNLKPAVILQQIQQHQINRITASPFLIKELSKYIIKNKINTDRIKKIFTGGAPVFPDEATLYNKAFPKAAIKIVYGSTEAEPISSISANELASLSMSKTGLPVGEIYSKIQLKIIKISERSIPSCSEEELTALQVNNGKIGEIIVSGKHVLKQYFRNDLAFAKNKIIVGKTIWHRTGDSGRTILDKLYLTGRCQQLIKTEQGYLSPFIIENLLQKINGIQVGTLIDNKGIRTLVIESLLSKKELIPKCTQFEYDTIRIIKKMPRDLRHNSKIDYNALKLKLKL